MTEAQWICRRCGKPLVEKETVLKYLGHSFTVKLLCCNMCGAVLIPPELAEGKMADVEKLLEEK